MFNKTLITPSHKVRVKAETVKHYRVINNVRQFDGEDCYQRLQVKRWWGWKTIDREEVPFDVKLSLGVYGEDPWRSKFCCVGSWGRDGVVTLKQSVYYSKSPDGAPFVELVPCHRHRTDGVSSA